METYASHTGSSLLTGLRGFSKFRVIGSRGALLQIFVWVGPGTSLVGYQSLHHVNRGIFLCPRKEGRKARR